MLEASYHLHSRRGIKSAEKGPRPRPVSSRFYRPAGQTPTQRTRQPVETIVPNAGVLPKSFWFQGATIILTVHLAVAPTFGSDRPFIIATGAEPFLSGYR